MLMFVLGMTHPICLEYDVSPYHLGSSPCTDCMELPSNRSLEISLLRFIFKYLSSSIFKPEYLADLLNFQTTSRSLRSSSRMRLHVDVARTVFASRAFCHAAPSIWNALPVHLTDFSLSLDSFKKQLKTYMYNASYRR